MRIALLPLACLAVSPALAASLPLKEGVFVAGACTPDRLARDASIGVFTLTEGGGRPEAFLVPGGEGQDGNCTLGRVAVKGQRHAGRADCRSPTGAGFPMGTYRFAYRIADRETFASRGRTYRWCAAHF